MILSKNLMARLTPYDSLNKFDRKANLYDSLKKFDDTANPYDSL